MRSPLEIILLPNQHLVASRIHARHPPPGVIRWSSGSGTEHARPRSMVPSLDLADRCAPVLDLVKDDDLLILSSHKCSPPAACSKTASPD